MLEIVKQPMLGNIPTKEIYYTAFIIAIVTLSASIVLTMKEQKKITLQL